MNTVFWAKAHGATTHFPIALLLCSGAFDVAAFSLPKRSIAGNLQAAGYWTLLLGAVGSIPAVASGILLTKGNLLGHGALRLHHWLVWPSFGLAVALATWRVFLAERPTRPVFAVYLVAMSLAAGLMSAAGYWGGEMMIAP